MESKLGGCGVTMIGNSLRFEVEDLSLKPPQFQQLRLLLTRTRYHTDLRYDLRHLQLITCPLAEKREVFDGKCKRSFALQHFNIELCLCSTIVGLLVGTQRQRQRYHGSIG